MPRPASLLPALVAVGALLASVLASVPAGGATAAVAAADTEPLTVEIETLSPSYVPDRGTVTLTGSVTNASDDVWRSIRVYAFMADTPMRSTAELDAATETPADAVVGERILLPDTFDDVGRLSPGESKDYSITLTRNQLPAEEAGVYWFGAHALGSDSAEAPDTFADGRARTFLSLVPPSTRGSLRASIVIPVRRPIRHTADGRIRSTPRWASDLDVDGRLRSLVELGAAAGTTPVTWLIDPAVPDAVARLVAGNRPRSLADTVPGPGDDEPSDSAEPDPESPTGSDDAETADPDASEDPDVRTNPAAEPGASWLERFEAAVVDDEVLTLPYGDPDVASTAANAPEFYEESVGRVGTELSRLRIPVQPAVAGPDGFLPPEAFYVLGDETVILSDAALEVDDPLTSARIDGRRVLFASSTVARGGPGPGARLSEIALRQRILAEAAVRLLYHDRAPLLVVLPETWQPDSPTSFWSGLDADWLDLTDTDDLGAGRPLDAEEVAYPVEQELTELDPENFAAAEQLIEAGRLLDDVLPRNDRVAAQVFDEALTAVSYSERDRALESRRDSLRAVEWIARRLMRVRVRATRGVTLSSATGTFATVVTNRLNHPVTVALHTESQGDVTVDPSPLLELAARSRQTVLLNADAGSPGVHYVRVRVTDPEGRPIGTSQRVAIRSAQVSQVIWLILGVGVGLLFVAIAIRVVRRIRSERA